MIESTEFYGTNNPRRMILHNKKYNNEKNKNNKETLKDFSPYIPLDNRFNKIINLYESHKT